jgi:hypothetical protein
MIPSLLGGLVGLWLVWLAVLDLALVDSHGWVLALSAIALLALGLIAFRADYLKWPGITDMVVGVLLLVLFFERGVARSDTLTFWALFWSGCISGVVSFWSTFYRHGPGSNVDHKSGAEHS